MAADCILFVGSPLAGRGEVARRLGWPVGWKDVTQPSIVRWRDRELAFDIGYRGARWQTGLDDPHEDNAGDHGYRQMRSASLRRADGVLFVVDSQPERQPANLEVLSLLAADLRFLGRPAGEVPVTFALNKRDLPNLTPVPELVATLMWPCCDHVETCAATGMGAEASIDRLLTLIDERRRAQRT